MSLAAGSAVNPKGRALKLAFIINDLGGGGAEKALKLLTDYLIRNGVKARVITLQDGNDGYQLHESIDRLTLWSSRLNRGPGKIMALPVQAAELARIVQRWNPDLCVSFLPRSNVAHVMTRWFGNRRPVVLTEQISTRDNYPNRSIGDRLMRRLIRYFYPRAEAVFPSSNGVMEGLVAFGVSPERMCVVYNAVSIQEIEEAIRETPDIEFGSVPTAITVGRHAEQKDHETLLKAFAIVRNRLDARLVFLGQGPLRDSLVSTAKRLCIQDSVVFAGWQKNPFAWMARADLFVLSSRFEGFGNVLVEAMACGLPVISTDCPSGPREILKDGEAGILVPVGDINALAAAMSSVFENQNVRARLVQESRKRAPEFDISVIGAQYLELLVAIAGDHGKKRRFTSRPNTTGKISL